MCNPQKGLGKTKKGLGSLDLDRTKGNEDLVTTSST